MVGRTEAAASAATLALQKALPASCSGCFFAFKVRISAQAMSHRHWAAAGHSTAARASLLVATSMHIAFEVQRTFKNGQATGLNSRAHGMQSCTFATPGG